MIFDPVDGVMRDEPSVPLVAEHILAEAAAMFRSRGYYKTRMQDIAQRFGVTHAALYYHFKSKNDILAQINLGAIGELLAGARDIEALDLPAIDRFRQMAHAHFLWVAQNAALASSLLNYDEELPPAAFEQIRGLRREYSKILRDVYREGVEDGSLADIDPRLAINFVIGSGNWISHWYHEGDSVAPAELAEIGMKLLADGFLRVQGARSPQPTPRSATGAARSPRADPHATQTPQRTA
ncbi:TetR/AcrR family transcriptional regulator [Streptomyces sp. NPDC001982]|uniref:TetR/AcrR family transcriptional regulator n=1 Tax=Streptomyces sp. NPDC001982 TaxID=3154405 RepID=UPI00332ABC10